MRLFIATSLVAAATLNAAPYQWQSLNGESPFTLDVPETWRTTESKKRNGVIVRFSGKKARIEVRSLADKEITSAAQLLNRKAARLASTYNSVRLIDERESRFRENLHLSVWEIKAKGRVFRDETAVIIGNAGPVTVSCMVPQDEYETYRTFCENAFYSVSLETVIATLKPGETATNTDLMIELGRLYFMHIPGNLPVISPDALIKSETTAPKPQNKPQYDENFILPDENNK